MLHFFYLVKYTKTFAFDIRGNDISNGETMYGVACGAGIDRKYTDLANDRCLSE